MGADLVAGTWTIIHSDGNSTIIRTEPTGKSDYNGDTITEPREISGRDEEAVAFEYMDGSIRVFPFATIFEINYKPDELTDDE